MKFLPSMLVALVLVMVVVGAGANPPGADFSHQSGEQLYQRFCASCHGASGVGDGVVAEALEVDVPDLTLLARRNRGRYPAARVSEIIDGRVILMPHGTRTMPVWGQEFWVEAGADSQAEYTARATIERLVNYVRTLQRPDPAEAER
ncbi:MAG TPA: cytochrome c [Steroidobacteraceae bacterium]|nr:cytochrome c [Steroidobacteraceae bacterium]